MLHIREPHEASGHADRFAGAVTSVTDHVRRVVARLDLPRGTSPLDRAAAPVHSDYIQPTLVDAASRRGDHATATSRHASTTITALTSADGDSAGEVRRAEPS